MILKPGIYQHYKGKQYQVLGIVNHSETLEKMVLYQALYESEGFEKDALWVRPLEMFLEDVEINGMRMPRFQLVGGCSSSGSCC
ncbi:DUF1653 domain-containing protein [Candidatus Babeliales bacterium]|nr:DUF1653 domain-containing protein [Candidatus Babeliales bacterium]